MPLTVLGDTDVNRILHSLTRDDILELQQSLADALHWYSTSNDANDCCSDFQPERTHLRRKDGSTTLFMPASGITGQGVKVVSIVPPDADPLSGLPVLAENLSIGSDQSSVSSPRSSMSTASATNNFTPSSPPRTASSAASIDTPTSTGHASLSSAPPSAAASAVSTIRGSLTLLDSQGNTTGLLNASELTAFRTALASTMLLKKRSSVHDLTVFGAGKQAYWHIRLAMLLRPGEIHHLNIVTRNFETARACILRLYNPQHDDPSYVNAVGSSYNSKMKANLLTPMHTEYERLLKEYVRAANAAIGSYKPHMIELHPDIVRNAVAPHHEHKHHHKRQKEGGAVIVDTVSGCLKEAGEVIQAKLLPDQVVELGELFMLKREAMSKAAAKGVKVDGGCAFQENSGLLEWLTKGNVIYKSVGLGLMDVVVGGELVRMARERGIGTTIEGF
ncbi:hypothetical protein LTR74_006960 [Friedmanniomyces endolithicus]|nr:hypothetical protein LTR74_006960 [Friedmanniomyces endolithicus]